MAVDIGQILVETGRISPAHGQQVQAHADAKGLEFDAACIDLGLLSEDDIADALGRHFEIPGFSLARMPRPSAKVTALIPEPIARRCQVVPLELAGKTLILLMADPTDIRTVQAVRGQTKLEVQPVVGSPATVRVALDSFYPKKQGSQLLANVLPFVGKLLTEEAARAYKALPVDRDGNVITVAMAGPNLEKTTKAIELATGLKVRAVEADAAEIEAAIERVHSSRPAPQAAAPAQAAKPESPPAAASTPPAAAPPRPAPGPVQSLDSLLGSGDLQPGPAPEPTPPAAAQAAQAGGLSLDLGGSEAPAKSASPASGGGAAGGLSLDLGTGGTASPPPAAPAPEARTTPAADLSLDGLLQAGEGAPAVPAGPDGDPVKVASGNGNGNGGVSKAALEAAAAAPAAPEEPAPPPATLADDDDDGGPDLSAGGGEGGPRTGLKVDDTERQVLKKIVEKKWGELNPTLAKLVPEKVARNYRILPTGRQGGTLYVAMEDPSDSFAIETAEFTSGLKVEVKQATPDEIVAGLEILYVPEEDDMADLLAEIEGVGLDEVMERDELEALSDLDAASAAEAAPVVRLVNKVISDALTSRASDIHFETYEEGMRVRFRVDGMLRETIRLPLDLRDPLVSRIKIMGRMDISERRLPQDGRLRMMKAKKPIDFRISTIPTVFGEKIVMRILDREQIQLDMTQLGFEPEPMSWFREAIHRPYGMVLVVGPSGCGKTNTLYSALQDVNRPDVNIMTCEDPVEFSTAGLNQVQAQEGIGLNFAAALRSFLRQDPNVILVGEIRDFETAEIAIKAALTGHMVLSTLHTNDAPACVNRLTNMGVEPFLIASSLHVVVAQRLIRRLCTDCRARDESIQVEQLVQMGFDPETARTIEPLRGKGCVRCDDTGYMGRTALFEVLRITDEMREMILYNGSQTEIKRLAVQQGMRTLRLAGLTKIRDGITTCEEVIRETIG